MSAFFPSCAISASDSLFIPVISVCPLTPLRHGLYNGQHLRAFSSIGRAIRLHRIGWGFESLNAHRGTAQPHSYPLRQIGSEWSTHLLVLAETKVKRRIAE